MNRAARWLSLMIIFCTVLISAQTKEIVGYYPSWKWRTQKKLPLPQTLAYTKITTVNYAFFSPRPDGTIVGRDSVGDAKILGLPGGFLQPGTDSSTLTGIAHRNNVKVLLSIGGWEDSGNFPRVASDPGTRSQFAHSCMQQIRSYGFDGIDIDWEYPCYAEHNGTPADRENFTLLLRVLRDSLNTGRRSGGQPLLLTAALPSGGPNAMAMDIKALGNILDFLNIMTYDFNGPWSPLANHNAPLYPSTGISPDQTVDGSFKFYTLSCGIQAGKLNLGIPFYGHTYTNCTALNTPHTGTDTIHFPNQGAFYNNIVEKMKNFTRSWDDSAKVPFLVSASWHMLVSYDDEESVRLKAQYVKEHGARGVIVWELTGDYLPDGSTPLLDVLAGELLGPNGNAAQKDLK